MSHLSDIRARSSWKDMLEGQPQHLGFAVLLAAGAISLLVSPPDAPHLLGLSSTGWAKLSIALAVIHQVTVALVFRLQLHRNLLSRWLGDRDMVVWRAIFMPLLVARPLSLIMTGWADATAITGYRPPEILIGAMLLALSIWAMHSVIVHFTIRRASIRDKGRVQIHVKRHVWCRLFGAMGHRATVWIVECTRIGAVPALLHLGAYVRNQPPFSTHCQMR